MYSDSHEILYQNYFLKSLPSEFEVNVIKVNQKGSGAILSAGFYETMMEKIDFIIDNLNNQKEELFLYSDADVQFFGNFKDQIIDELGDFDIAFQDDDAQLCLGFFICRKNKNTVLLFDRMKEIMDKRNYLRSQCTDQSYLKQVLSELCINYKKLSGAFFNIAQVTHKIWNGELVNVPKNILVHHANFTVGIDNKVKLLNMVKSQLI